MRGARDQAKRRRAIASKSEAGDIESWSNPQIVGGIRIEQYFKDHHPPHFHAILGNDEALITIAEPMTVIRGNLKPNVLRDVLDWAGTRRAALALNWVDALAQQPIRRIP